MSQGESQLGRAGAGDAVEGGNRDLGQRLQPVVHAVGETDERDDLVLRIAGAERGVQDPRREELRPSPGEDHHLGFIVLGEPGDEGLERAQRVGSQAVLLLGSIERDGDDAALANHLDARPYGGHGIRSLTNRWASRRRARIPRKRVAHRPASALVHRNQRSRQAREEQQSSPCAHWSRGLCSSLRERKAAADGYFSLTRLGTVCRRGGRAVRFDPAHNKWLARLKPLVEPEGDLFICHLDVSKRNGWMSTEFWEWLKKKLE